MVLRQVYVDLALSLFYLNFSFFLFVYSLKFIGGWIAMGDPVMVEHAAGFGSLLVDATFSIAPRPLFYQCLTINVVEEMNGVQKLFTSLYVLMTHKNELLYDDFWRGNCNI